MELGSHPAPAASLVGRGWDELEHPQQLPPSSSVSWPLLSAFGAPWRRCPHEEGRWVSWVRGRQALHCSFQRRKNRWYPAVFTASTHVLLVSMKATMGANLRLSPRSVCSFCMKPDWKLTDKPLQRCVQTPFLPFRLCSTLLRSELFLPSSAGAFECLLIGRINPPTGCKQRFTLSLGRIWTVQGDLGAGELPSAFQRGHSD